MSRVTRAIAALSLSLTVGSALLVEPTMVAAQAPASGATYTVKPGDYLTGIAATLKVRLSDLLAANKMTVTSMIYPGMQLVVPSGGVLPAAAPAAGAAAPSAAIYTVQSGDYLSGIASKMGVSLTALLSTNKLTASSAIYPGTKLVVPAGGTLPGAPTTPAAPSAGLVYVVRSGDYLTGIAPKLGVKVTDLLALNKLTLNSMIYPGMKLQVPAGGKLPAAPAPSTGSGNAAPIGSSANSRINKVLNFAQAQLGEPYKFNAAGPDQWDCSGLTMAAYAEAGISLPHYSGAQVAYGTPVDWRTQAIQPGDLIFLESFVGSGVINHVGIAISSTQWIQAPRTGDVVRVGSIPSVRVIAVRRIISNG
ncbi:MAG: LysM peptidoglycan-binding domain-containing protein [Ilumatobacteraceae bacterium]